ncbi:23S rRNA (uracil(1939)-C(5))-methyltransferase RlmD [Haloplasma contractile]|uniref:23S rRNA -methyltransferase RumA protein n=1 Tax=Haloplasma contractile SSD-17B TaxID=1033810 RepID=U2FLD3_9MOLU|nr:23S rRNA (uracil(1939)-C(5))-methyltransferase RlmD [Haloplasma contractile]ERJ13550.1 23S rRNA -methyltransferase RumA protein [Haloplasma contractile SSD-17B]
MKKKKKQTQMIQGKCINSSDRGMGIVKWKHNDVYVPNLIFGEEAKIKITGKSKSHYFGEIVSIIKESPLRTKPGCAIYDRCGGCQLMHVSYEGQLKEKQRYVLDVMKTIAKHNVTVDDIIPMKDPYRYRNKIQVAFSSNKKGDIVAGFYEENTHKVVQMETCHIQDKIADAIVGSFKEIMKQYKIRPYDEDKRVGLIRHILIRRGFHTDQTMVVIVTSSNKFPGRNNVVKALRNKHPEIDTIIQNTNPRKTSIVLGEQERVLFGKGYIVDVLCGMKFKISPKSFYQVNPVQTETLYNKAIDLANLKGNERVLDAYCGIGTIGLIASRKAGNVIGVEVNKDAIQDAIGNAKINNVKNVRFFTADASVFMVELSNNNEKIDVVFLDPPRSGCDERFLKSLIKLKPKRVVYISCDPKTQARDLSHLIKGGYKVNKIQPVDMFPHTHHVECIVSLEKE